MSHKSVSIRVHLWPNRFFLCVFAPLRDTLFFILCDMSGVIIPFVVY
jgi:hypothetical protein